MLFFIHPHSLYHTIARDTPTSLGTEMRSKPIVRPYSGAVGPGFVLMHDNVRLHEAKVCQQFLHNEDNVMDWPALSPDLNPIEYI